MRGLVDELAAPRPLIESLPGIYQEDDLARLLTSVFDDALAPVLCTIDNLPSYLDPALTPDDFLDWLAGWVGVLPDETWPVERRRALVALAVQLHRRRGTAAGMAMHVRLLGAADVEVEDSGGAIWSKTPGAKPPGDGTRSVTVKVTPPKKGQLDSARIEALVASLKPAHVVHRVALAGSPAK
ncbi:MAG: phage tail protein I [Chloroflexi bacterium]|nr:phage tail protein I [Chloroflexota bacterium]